MRSRVDSGFRPRIPLVVVGALRSGGSGKTSVTSEMARVFSARGRRVAILAYRLGRGGRASGAGGSQLDREILLEVHENDDWRRSSDEAVMLRRESGVRVFVTRDRAEAWKRLHDPEFQDGQLFDLILSDDGFQDPRLDKALRILLVAPGESPRLRDLLPAGPFRERAAARARADLILEGPFPEGSSLEGGRSGRPGFRRELILPEGWDPGWACIAASALGDNDRFLADLGRKGITPVAVIRGRDHEPLDSGLLVDFAARFPGAGFLCTFKDSLKLEPEAAARLGVRAVGQRIHLDPSVLARVEAYLQGFGRDAQGCLNS